MTKKLVALAGVSALALTVGAIAPASATDSSVLLAQAGSPQRGAAPSTSAPASRGATGSQAAPRSGAQSGSMGTASGSLVGSQIPAECARIQDNAAQLQACFDRHHRGAGGQPPR